MRTLGSVSENTKLKIASETLFIYAPLAHRLGLNAVKTEMEDLALKFTDPIKYKEISSRLSETKNARQRYIKEFIEPIKEELDKSGLKILEIKGRPKSIFSISRKMEKQHIPFEEVFDAFAIRVIVDSPLNLEKADCWKIYSIITDKYRSHTNRLRDWLSHPKSNGYSALHTTVLGPKGRWVEVQIRSKRMDDIAERGLAAHWKYKAGSKIKTPTPQDVAFENWLDTVKETLSNSDLSALDLVSEFRTSLLGEEIYIFTPKGDVKSLPTGSTALDFAFAIHTEIGIRTLGAKVNNKLVALQTVLKNGDIIEILTTSKVRIQKDWLEIVKTARAKSKIREALKAERTQRAKQGKLLLERLFRKHNLELSDSNIKKLMHHFKFSVSAEFFHSVADGQIRLNKDLLVRIIKKKAIDTPSEITEDVGAAQPVKKAKSKSEQIIIGDDYESSYTLAQCCHPVPGDSIFGFVTVGEGVMIHRTTCPNATRLMSQYGYRIIPAEWRGDGYQKAFETAIGVRGIDDVGIVSRITDIISKDMEVNMKSINISSNQDGTFGGKIEVMIYDLLHLEQLITKIKATHKYIQVTRED
jgi:GTP pyrophosphokinase